MIKYLIHFRSLTLISLYLGAEKRGDRRTERERPRESERERDREREEGVLFYIILWIIFLSSLFI